jgi:hypothetical protein
MTRKCLAKKNKKLGRPPIGKERKIVCSIRLEPKTKKKLIKIYGSLQKAIDHFIKKAC